MSTSEAANKKPTIVEVDADEINMELDGSSSSSSSRDIVVSGAHLFFFENGNLKQGRQITLTDLYQGELKAELSAFPPNAPVSSSDRVVIKMGSWIVNAEKASQLSRTKTKTEVPTSWSFVGPQDIAGILWEDEENQIPATYDDTTKILIFEGSEFHLLSKSGPTKLEFE